MDFMSPDGSAPEKDRAKPVQHEKAEQVRLSKWSRSMWWGQGYHHIEQATFSQAEAHQKHSAGVRSGPVDVLVFVPMPKHRKHVMLALELKAPGKAPKRKVEPLWWLEWKPDIGLNHNPSRYGLRWSQASFLQLLHGVGFETYVAFSAHDAFDWINWQCGSEPSQGVDWP